MNSHKITSYHNPATLTNLTNHNQLLDITLELENSTLAEKTINVDNMSSKPQRATKIKKKSQNAITSSFLWKCLNLKATY